ncbi:MAG: hypothetical protein R3E95_24070 [Thiolinea sp.]
MMKFLHCAGWACARFCYSTCAVHAKATNPAEPGSLPGIMEQQQEVELMLTGNQQLFPDNRMLYTVFFENTGLKASNDIDITSPVPPDTIYVPDSASGENCDILFSVDGGEHWGRPEELRVRDKSGTWRTARAGDYTHIRWRYRPELRPAEVQRVSFSGEVAVGQASWRCSPVEASQHFTYQHLDGQFHPDGQYQYGKST